jgi:hypothetical protein
VTFDGRQGNLFDEPSSNPRFDGSEYNRSRDDKRLTGQLFRIWECMKDGHWRTLQEIATVTNDPEASISAQLRHLRKPRFGSHEIEKKYLGEGLYEYKLIINTRSESCTK